MRRVTLLKILVLSGIPCALLPLRAPAPDVGHGTERGSVPARARDQRASEVAGKNQKAARPVQSQHEMSGLPAGPDETITAATPVAPSPAVPAAIQLHSAGEPAADAVREERHCAWLTAKTRKDRPHAGLADFPVPASLASLPLPVYLVHRTPAVSAVELSHNPDAVTPSPGPAIAPRQDATVSEVTVGKAAVSDAAVAEATAIGHAESLFFDAMTAAPVVDAESPEYAEWWNAAQFRSDEYLRAALGWDRFNTLSGAAKKEILDGRESVAGQ